MALRIRLELIPPQNWQKLLGIGNSSGMEKADWKRKLKSEAERRFPNQKITLANCDALLMLDVLSKNSTLKI